MSQRLRNSLYLGLIIGLLVAVVIGLIPRDTTSETAAERSHRIASELRCPFCHGESIADAQSAIAADARDLIDEQIATGMTDTEIFDYFVARYTERVLLSPPLLGWGTLLWALPLLLLVGGVAALRRRKRRAVPAPIVVSSDALDDAKRVVAADLADIEVQQATGELDEDEASRLRESYISEQQALAATEVAAPQPEPPSRKRRLVGTAILVVGALALTVGVVVTVQDRTPGDLITGGVADPSNAPRDLTKVTDEELEEVVAANPDVIGMRMALAGRYFDGGEFSDALRHYMEVLAREQHPEALANVGWMTYLSDEIDTGLKFVERSLEVTPDLPQAYWYLANIRYWGMNDPAGAVAPLETLLEFEAIPDEVRALATDLLTQVRAAL
ncbi:MAG: hypothetical protein GY720_15685 [bacterium]|nr:hypothetical protein [bacterium]